MGTLAALEPGDQRHIAGYVVNKFRGDIGLLQPGLELLEKTEPHRHAVPLAKAAIGLDCLFYGRGNVDLT